MWHMLCESGRDLAITFKDVSADDQTDRDIHNILEAEFEFKDSLIFCHRDRFNFWRWSHLALGPAGTFLGWTPLIRDRVRQTAARNLEKFIARHPKYQGQ